MAAVCIFFIGCGQGKWTLEDELVAAARNDDVVTGPKLLKRGANINGMESGIMGETPLIACSATDGTNMFYFLLTHAANVNIVGGSGQTPLTKAITLGDANVAKVRELNKRGANVHTVDQGGVSLLRKARAGGVPLVTQELIAAGAKE